MPDTLFATLSGLESPARMGFVVAWSDQAAVLPDAPTVILDRLQELVAFRLELRGGRNGQRQRKGRHNRAGNRAASP